MALLSVTISIFASRVLYDQREKKDVQRVCTHTSHLKMASNKPSARSDLKMQIYIDNFTILDTTIQEL